MKKAPELEIKVKDAVENSEMKSRCALRKYMLFLQGSEPLKKFLQNFFRNLS